MLDHLQRPGFVALRAAVLRFVDDELRPIERELQLDSEAVWPRDVLRRVWRCAAALGFCRRSLLALAVFRNVARVHLSLLETVPQSIFARAPNFDAALRAKSPYRCPPLRLSKTLR
ncbi:acyl-CoA dehydrogenase family protein [Burkholderia territorii]|uniref:acyl-CoA dehydrogenase family protein n=1 Tax=Burkholderia territorii TaxID=1503055 RepID=UPI000A60E1FE|nr:acyl-CoA dehydrogenase family protein [Burkholderia territorii]